MLGNLGPGKAQGVETTNSGSGPNLIRSGLVIDVIKAIGFSCDDVQRVLFGAIISPLNLVEERKKLGSNRTERRRQSVSKSSANARAS